MGRLATMITILICVDLLLVVTGQVSPTDNGTIGSLIITSVLDLKNAQSGLFFDQLIGNVSNIFGSTTGILALIVGGATAIIAGIAFRQSDTLLFIPIAISLSTISADFIFIYAFLAQWGPASQILATLIIGPTFVMYIFTCLEWLRGKD